MLSSASFVLLCVGFIYGWWFPAPSMAVVISLQLIRQTKAATLENAVITLRQEGVKPLEEPLEEVRSWIDLLVFSLGRGLRRSIRCPLSLWEVIQWKRLLCRRPAHQSVRGLPKSQCDPKDWRFTNTQLFSEINVDLLFFFEGLSLLHWLTRCRQRLALIFFFFNACSSRMGKRVAQTSHGSDQQWQVWQPPEDESPLLRL